MTRMAVCFSPQTLPFLRSLARNNNREWFRARKDDYERYVRTPMLAVIDRLARDFRDFAPDLLASRDSLYRIYRETRFSEDKRPLKTHLAATFWSRRLPRLAVAGLPCHIGPNADRDVWLGGRF